MDLHAALLADHSQTIEAVIDAAETVATDGPYTEPARLRDSLTAELQARGLQEPILGLLGTAADAAGAQIQGAPIPAPPYLSVTSRGPVCRGTLADGQRLVVELVAFAVERQPRRYVFADPAPVECLTVSLREAE